MEHRPSPGDKSTRPARIRRVNGHAPSPVPHEEQQPVQLHERVRRIERESAHKPERVWPRYASVAFGLWLFVSAFLWPHSDPSRANSWFVGVLIAAAGLWGLRDPAGRLLNTLVALWLLMSTLLIYPRGPLTFWNNLLVGVIVLGLSLVPTRSAADPAVARRRG